MEYRAEGPACPASCMEPKGPAKCALRPREGCFCKKGFVLSDDKCVREAQCGCKDGEGEYYPVRNYLLFTFSAKFS